MSTNNNVEQIKERLDIVEVISSYIKVEKAGINWKAKCPFHNEKTPSFFISQSRQSFYCFGCGEKGDIFTFVEKFEGLDFKGALELLAKKAGIELKKENKKETDNKEKLFKLMEEATNFFQKNLMEDPKASDYLTKRGLGKETIKKWRLGLAKDEWRSLFDELGRNWGKEMMLEAGLIKKMDNSKQEKYYDTFRNRIIFPIFDSAGRVIAFSGRFLGQDKNSPKYLNSPETKLFHKGDVLYGLNFAKNEIRRLNYAILVEGQMDLLMAHQAKTSNTVASSGTALTENHLKKIQKITDRIVLAYDCDEAGEKASIRASEIALSLGMEVKIANLEKEEDPASTIKKDPNKWKNSLKKSENIIDFVLNKIIREGRLKDQTRDILQNVLPLVSLLKSDIEKSQQIKKIALKIGVPEEAVFNDLKKIKKDEGETIRQYYGCDVLNKPKDNIEKILSSLVFFEETKNNKSEIKKRWIDICGDEEVKKTLDFYEKNKEELLFYIEKQGEINIEKTGKEIIERLHIEKLREKLKEKAKMLDQKDLSEKEEGKIKKEFEKIQKKISELSK